MTRLTEVALWLGAVIVVGMSALSGGSLLAQTSQATCETSGGCRPPGSTKIIYVDGEHYTLESAVTAANAAGDTIVLVPTDQMIPNGLALTGTGVQLICLNKATIIAGSGNFWMITMTGKNELIRDCAISPGSFSTSKALLVERATTPTIEGVTISGFRSGNGLIYLIETASPILQSNHLTTGPGGPDGIFGEKNMFDIDIENNIVDESRGGVSAHAIAFHSTLPEKTVRGAKIVNNRISAGLNFCLEIGSFGGLTPSNIEVNNNTCKLTRDGGSGGYSLVVQDSSEMDNTFDANGFTATIAAYEIVKSKNVLIKGNVASIGPAWTSVPTSAVTINQSSDITFTENVVRGWGGGDPFSRGGFAVAVVSAGINNAIVQNNLISKNVFVFPAGHASGGVFQQCDANGSLCSNNSYVGNVFLGDTGSRSLAFRLENDEGIMANTVISDNTFLGLPYGIYIWNSRVARTHICHNANQAEHAIFDAGSGSVITNDPCPQNR